jgi:hypothetical protein
LFAGQLGGVAGHAARVGGNLVPGAGPARGPLLREAHHAVRAEDAHGPRRDPQELDAQGHLHLAPQLPAVSLGRGTHRGDWGPRFIGPGHCPVGPLQNEESVSPECFFFCFPCMQMQATFVWFGFYLIVVVASVRRWFMAIIVRRHRTCVMLMRMS